jgi:hypothetical protein
MKIETDAYRPEGLKCNECEDDVSICDICGKKFLQDQDIICHLTNYKKEITKHYCLKCSKK